VRCSTETWQAGMYVYIIYNIETINVMLEIAYEKCVAALRRGKQACMYVYII